MITAIEKVFIGDSEILRQRVKEEAKCLRTSEI